MKLALSITMGLGLLLTGCLGSEDIIARTAVGKVGHDQKHDLPDGAPDSECSPQASRVMVITKSGRLFALQPETGEVENLGIPSCLSYQGFSLAIDHNGAIWVQPNKGNMQVIDPVTLKCTERDIKVEMAAMAFVYDPATEKELLYGMELDTLSVIDPKTLKETRLAKLDRTQPIIRSFTGTRDGQLLAVTDGPAPHTYRIRRVDLATGTFQTVWPSVDLGDGDDYFMGGAIWRDDFILGFSNADNLGPSGFLRFSTETEQTSPLATYEIEEGDGQSMLIASSTCASAPQN
ncbi:MAG TPA: hypothetical protein VJV78_29375 [Polyangiales bacterium]|nr:hypothetical protein [Polyangiales bacterium]